MPSETSKAKPVNATEPEQNAEITTWKENRRDKELQRQGLAMNSMKRGRKLNPFFVKKLVYQRKEDAETWSVFSVYSQSQTCK